MLGSSARAGEQRRDPRQHRTVPTTHRVGHPDRRTRRTTTGNLAPNARLCRAKIALLVFDSVGGTLDRPGSPQPPGGRVMAPAAGANIRSASCAKVCDVEPRLEHVLHRPWTCPSLAGQTPAGTSQLRLAFCSLRALSNRTVQTQSGRASQGRFPSLRDFVDRGSARSNAATKETPAPAEARGSSPP